KAREERPLRRDRCCAGEMAPGPAIPPTLRGQPDLISRRLGRSGRGSNLGVELSLQDHNGSGRKVGLLC
ncbi:MAG: hypothetical protein ACE5I5_18605, partial [Candidatus Heimdallarchaeota archaeon]